MRLTLFIISIGCFVITGCRQNPPKTGTPPEDYYTEQYRPQYHFSPDSGWMNDPNGMVFHEGEYHLFYQYYPNGIVWDTMHWGHTVSPDMVQWEHLPIALYPDTLGVIFSGSAVVDAENTSGLGEDGEPPMVAIFSYNNLERERASRIDKQYQGIAYSNDNGRTWIKYAGNPVLENPGIRDFRDPKVMWHEPTEKWIMTLAVQDHINFYSSPNLIDWTKQSEFGRDIGGHGGVWECPDLFKMPIEGTNESKWILLVSVNPGGPNSGSATQYFIGDFDGTTFILNDEFAENLGSEPAFVPEGSIFADFENGYGNWTVEGNAFGEKPVPITENNPNQVAGFSGNHLANSLMNGVAATGTLTSPAYLIKEPHINFKIAGGQHRGETGIQLVVDDEIVRTAIGNFRNTLVWQSWDVREFLGKKARLQIIDQHTGEKGYILVDQIMFAEKAARPRLEKAIWLDYGRDNYACVTWSNIPESDGRRLVIGWMSNWQYGKVVPATAWRSAMTLPRKLVLRNTPEGLRLFSTPVQELQQLRSSELSINPRTLEATLDLTRELPISPMTMEAILEFEMPEGSAANFGIEISNEQGEHYRVGYDAAAGQYYSDRTDAGVDDFSDVFANALHTAPRIPSGKTIRLHLFVDKASVEVFADDGATVITDLVFPSEEYTRVKLFAENGKVELTGAQFFALQTIWR